MTDDLRITVERTHGPATLVAVAGELDYHTSPRLRSDALALIEGDRPHLVLDLSGVSFCDSSGLSVLIGLWNRAQAIGGSLVLCSVPERLMRLIRMTGLDQVLSITTAEDCLTDHPAPARDEGPAGDPR
ncbi:anti-sigma factor antagonist [Streptomyces taklimakanensis]|uniref:anti-sigma factor antagonist n=1 Tax=Streptomyces taklimakanensis TaxID=2569853 RepID=UPI001390C6CC